VQTILQEGEALQAEGWYEIQQFLQLVLQEEDPRMTQQSYRLKLKERLHQQS